MASDLPPLPCTLVTGFLGAGKTTLLNHMLTQSAGRRIGCLVNEFGAIDIDSTLLASDTVAINSGVVELSNGCICCTINDSLRNAVAAMLQRRTDLDLLLIETTGIADPAPCLTTLWLPEFEGLLRVDGVVTVADATTIARSLASDPKIDAAAAPATDAKATSGGSSSSRIGSSGSSSSGGAASAAAEQKPVCFAQQLASADLLVLNKIDLPGADLEASAAEMESTLGIDGSGAIPASAKVGTGVAEVLEAIVQRIPPPSGLAAACELPLRALIFDSYYDSYRGVIVFVRVVDGALRKGERIQFAATGAEHDFFSAEPALASVDSCEQCSCTGGASAMSSEASNQCCTRARAQCARQPRGSPEAPTRPRTGAHE